MSCRLDAFLVAVSKRKATDKKLATNRVNLAILLQLEQSDIPLLIQICKLQYDALKNILDLAPNDDMYPSHAELQRLMDQIATMAAESHIHVEALASQGSTARWGDYDGDTPVH